MKSYRKINKSMLLRKINKSKRRRALFRILINTKIMKNKFIKSPILINSILISKVKTTMINKTLKDLIMSLSKSISQREKRNTSSITIIIKRTIITIITNKINKLLFQPLHLINQINLKMKVKLELGQVRI